eukprot:CAMPEP_0183735192 /NCGR_PEP_ID=MMETSP0737-20130205/45953_1 /TAXON_ID=385413 /ORGANISM="Thalassiosira miniscula, Strain CCMP1093" /LENGTH=526 /DNA_ID=CAMNT_0025968861 /DNA_START=84 /DNA_END=1664 /DNA_ORIENTATION=-
MSPHQHNPTTTVDHGQKSRDGDDGDNANPTSPLLPKPTSSEVQACQFSSWYSTFRNMRTAATDKDNNTASTTSTTTIHPNPPPNQNKTNKKLRKNVTIESIIIRPLPPEFIEYLSADGVCLPQCATKVSSCMNDGNNNNDDRWDSSSDDEDANNNGGGDSDSDDDSEQAEPMKQYNFPNLTNQIQSAITTLGGGGCMPKLNWSSPKDATWMNCGSLKCTKVGDVCLLLKSSDFIGFDLHMAWDNLAEEDEEDGAVESSTAKVEDNMDNLAIHESSQESHASVTNGSGRNKNSNKPPPGFEYELVLRKWCNLHPSMEFRCFIYNHEMVAISQRHPSKQYPHLQLPTDETIHPSAILIHAFFQTYVQHRFAHENNTDIPKYVLDVYLDSQERVWIVDFNVWGDRTDALLFDWMELMELGMQHSQQQQQQQVDTEKKNGNEHGNDNGGDDEDEVISLQATTMMPEMRVVTKDMKSMTYDPLSSYRGPTDVMNILSGNGGNGNGDDVITSDGNVSAFQDFMNQCVRPSEM